MRIIIAFSSPIATTLTESWIKVRQTDLYTAQFSMRKTRVLWQAFISSRWLHDIRVRGPETFVCACSWCFSDAVTFGWYRCPTNPSRTVDIWLDRQVWVEWGERKSATRRGRGYSMLGKRACWRWWRWSDTTTYPSKRHFTRVRIMQSLIRRRATSRHKRWRRAYSLPTFLLLPLSLPLFSPLWLPFH